MEWATHNCCDEPCEACQDTIWDGEITSPLIIITSTLGEKQRYYMGYSVFIIYVVFMLTCIIDGTQLFIGILQYVFILKLIAIDAAHPVTM